MHVFTTCQATDGGRFCTLEAGHDVGPTATLHQQYGCPWEATPARYLETSLPPEADQAVQEDGAHCPRHGPTAYAQGEDDFTAFTGYAGGSCYAARMLCGCWDVDESADVEAAR